MAWHDIVGLWSDMLWKGLAWHGRGIVWHDMIGVWYGMS